MAKNKKLTLADGMPVEDLFSLDTREVSLRAMADEALYQHELEELFGKGWNLLGHESEIPESGDYVVRPIGEDEMLVTRDRLGEIHVSLNVCSHRGMRLALGEAGNSAFHKCIYHGWAFRPNGDFIGAPVERAQMQGELCDKSELGLQKARVELYGGLIFATWNIEGPSFEEYLGDAKFYFDMLWNRTDSGLEVLGPPQKVFIDCNWKCSGEQSGGDGFHTLTLHRWLIEAGLFGGGGEDAPAMEGINVSANGHNVRCIPVETTYKSGDKDAVNQLSVEERLFELPPPGITAELVPQLKKHLSGEQITLMVKAPPQVGGIFPNLNFLFVYAPQPDGTMLGAMGIHIIVPRGVDKSEFWTWIFAEKDCPEDVKQKMLRSSVQQIGTSGLIEQDDTDTWPHISRSARGAIARKRLTMRYQAINGEKTPEGWPGGGRVYEGFSKDDSQWEWWKAYYRALTGLDSEVGVTDSGEEQAEALRSVK